MAVKDGVVATSGVRKTSEVMAAHPSKILTAILVKPVPMVTDFKFGHILNAMVPVPVTLSGIVADAIPEYMYAA